MLKLEMGPPFARPLPAAPGDRAVQVWTDAKGVALAYAWLEDGWSWIGWPGLAAFRFSPDLPVVTAFPDGNGSEVSVRDIFYRFVLPVALQARGFEALHASAVLRGQSAIVFCAQTEVGKSTISFALAARGCRQLADDSVVLDLGESGVSLIPLPFRPDVKPLPGVVTPDAVPATASRSGVWHHPEADAAPIPLGAIFVLDRLPAGAGPAVKLRRLDPVQAYTAVLAHAHCYDVTSRESRRRLLMRYLDLVEAVPVLKVEFRPGFDTLPEVLDEIVRASQDPRAWHSPIRCEQS